MSYEQRIKHGIKHLEAVDPRLGSIFSSYPEPTFHPHTDYYRALVESIISQQLSVRAADTIYRRFIDSFDHFPEPEDILACDETKLRAVGLSGPKVRYIRDLASKIVDGSVRFDHLDLLTNEDIVAELTTVKGIGEWTVHMFLLFCMGRLDVLPVGDLGIKNAVQQLYLLETLPSPDDIKSISQQNSWHPYESIASWYLWRSIENHSEQA